MLINLIPYSTILSIVLEKYIKDNEHLFVNNDNTYVLTTPFKINVLHSHIANTIDQVISGLSSSNIYILGECHIYNNWRMTLAYNQINPSNKQLIDERSTIKYVLKEDNIKVNELRFNHIADTYFNKQFKIVKNNIRFFKHKHLTEDDLINIFKSMFSDKNLNIIDKYNNILKKVNDAVYNIKYQNIPIKYVNTINELICELQINK